MEGSEDSVHHTPGSGVLVHFDASSTRVPLDRGREWNPDTSEQVLLPRRPALMRRQVPLPPGPALPEPRQSEISALGGWTKDKE